MFTYLQGQIVRLGFCLKSLPLSIETLSFKRATMKGRAFWPQSCKLSQFPNFIHRAGSERQPTPRAEQQAEAATLTRPQGGNTVVAVEKQQTSKGTHIHVASRVSVASGILNNYLQILHRYPRPAQRLPGHFTCMSGLPNIYLHSLHHQYI